ncbi:MAG: hypothetical protein CMJ83_18660 [Planctomycetes bacterium]|nr:hypothetical protein [Planctomycetota bacterium]
MRWLVLGLLAGVVCAQGKTPDKKTLDKALKGRVEAWSDGVLSLRWPFDAAAELDDFDTRGFSPVSRRVENGRLFLEQGKDDESPFARLDHLHFQPPFSVRLQMTPKFDNAGLVLGLVDTKARGGQTWILLNAPVGKEPGDRIFGIFRTRAGAGAVPIAGPRTQRVEAGKPLEVAIEIRGGEMTVTVGGRKLFNDPLFTHGSFSFFFGPGGAGVEVDDLRIHGRPVPSSLRKLVLGERAEDSDAAKRLEEGRTAGVAMAVARLDEPFSRELRRTLRDLEPGARKLVARARKAEGSRDFEDAALLLQEASMIAPDSAIILWRAGWNLSFSGEYELALKAYEAALKKDDELAVAWRDLGALNHLLEHDVGALAAFDKSIDLDPENALGYALKGMLLQGQGKLDEALALYEEARAIKPAEEAYSALQRVVKRLKTPPEWEIKYTEETEHYEVSTNVGEKFAKRVARRLEIYRDFLAEVCPLPESARTGRSPVWIFDARGQYNVFAGTLMSRTAESTAGVYHPAIRTLLLFDDVDRESTFDTLFHEAFHQYLDRVNASPPIWFNEGMAELFGALEVDDNGVKGLGLHVGRLRELRHTLIDEPESIPDLDDLLRMTKVAFYDRDTVSLHYAVAWSLCHYFMTGTRGKARDLFRTYAKAILEGKTGDEAYQASFGAEAGKKAESFRRGWLRHLRRLP